MRSKCGTNIAKGQFENICKKPDWVHNKGIFKIKQSFIHTEKHALYVDPSRSQTRTCSLTSLAGSIVCLYTDVLTYLEDIGEDRYKHVYSGRLWVGGIPGLFHFILLISTF